MELSVGPIKVHAATTGSVREHDDGSMEVYVTDREGHWKGKLFLNTEEVGLIKQKLCGIRRI